MHKEELLIKLKNKDNIKSYIDNIDNYELISYLFELVESTNITKYQAEKVIRMISETNTKLLYPYFDRMIKFLKDNNKFIRFGFILTISNLLENGISNKWQLVKEYYIKFLESETLIEYCNTVKSLHKILRSNPKEEDVFLPYLLNISKHTFYKDGKPSLKCKDIAKSAILDCFYKIYETSNYKKQIIKFVKKYKNNSKSQLKNKSNKFLKKYER